MFGLDLVGQANNVDSAPHIRDKGLNSLFTDGSVVVVKNAEIWTIVTMGGLVNALHLENMLNVVDGGP